MKGVWRDFIHFLEKKIFRPSSSRGIPSGWMDSTALVHIACLRFRKPSQPYECGLTPRLTSFNRLAVIILVCPHFPRVIFISGISSLLIRKQLRSQVTTSSADPSLKPPICGYRHEIFKQFKPRICRPRRDFLLLFN